MNIQDSFVMALMDGMRHRFPHIVTVQWRGITQQEHITKWCELNVGERGTWWEYLTMNQYAFRNVHHATEFSLTWSAS